MMPTLQNGAARRAPWNAERGEAARQGEMNPMEKTILDRLTIGIVLFEGAEELDWVGPFVSSS